MSGWENENVGVYVVSFPTANWTPPLGGRENDHVVLYYQLEPSSEQMSEKQDH